MRAERIGLWVCILLLAWAGHTPALAEGVRFEGGLEVGADMTLKGAGQGVRFPDGSRQVSAGVSYRQTVVVRPEGDPETNGGILIDVLDRIPGEDPDHPWLLKIEPGVYNVRDHGLQMKPWVDMAGSGEGVTRITGQVDSSTLGVVTGASHAELRFLTVENTGGGSQSIAVANLGSAGRLTRVRAVASGSATNIGVLNDQGAAPTLEQVTAEASGGNTNYGIRNRDASPGLTDVVAAASGGETNYGLANSGGSPLAAGLTARAVDGVYNYAVYNSNTVVRMTGIAAAAEGGEVAYAVRNESGAALELDGATLAANGATSQTVGMYTEAASAALRQVRVQAEGVFGVYGIWNHAAVEVSLAQVTAEAIGTGYSYAIHNSGSPITLFGVRAEAPTGTDAYGLFLTEPAHVVRADDCVFGGNSLSISKTGDVTLLAGASQLKGAVSNVGDYQCSGCFDADANPLGADCRPLAP